MNTNNISMALSARYQRLVQEVLDCLPSGWHGDRVVRLGESRETLHLTHGWPAVAYAARLQFKSDEAWIITLYTSSLDTLSDESVRWKENLGIPLYTAYDGHGNRRLARSHPFLMPP